jgi:hypothetical protein
VTAPLYHRLSRLPDGGARPHRRREKRAGRSVEQAVETSPPFATAPRTRGASPARSRRRTPRRR